MCYSIIHSIMWALFGTRYDEKVENKSYSYFMGIFIYEKMAKDAIEDISKKSRRSPDEYFIREVKLNSLYSYYWSNSDEL